MRPPTSDVERPPESRPSEQCTPAQTSTERTPEQRGLSGNMPVLSLLYYIYTSLCNQRAR